MQQLDTFPEHKGRFAKGNPGGPGRASRKVETEYLDAVIAGVSLSEWGKVIKKALEQAKKGDAKARDWLSKYLIGDDPKVLVAMMGDRGAAFFDWNVLVDEMEKANNTMVFEGDTSQNINEIVENGTSVVPKLGENGHASNMDERR